MEEAGAGLYNLFELAVLELDVLHNKLSAELKERLKGTGVSPADLIKRIQVVSANILEMKEHVAIIQSKKQVLLKKLEEASSSNRQMLEQLKQAAGTAKIAPRSPTEEEKPVVSAKPASRKSSRKSLEVGKRKASDTKSDPLKEKKENGNGMGNDFISQEVFKTLSATIKGKTQLKDLNNIMRVLKEFFAKDPHAESITIAQLSKLGIKVTGVTGKNALNCLRQLHLVTVNRNKISLVA